jgi:hypothetical protein
VKLSTDFTASRTLHPRESLFVTGNLGSVNAEIVIASDGSASVMVDLRGTFSGTFEVAGTVDGTNWIAIPVRGVNIAAIGYVAAITGAAAGVWIGGCLGYRQVRVRCTAYTSGTAIAHLVTSLAPDNGEQNLSTTSVVTAVGASGAAVTLTLPAPGAGLRQYITYIAVNRFAAALLTAAAAPVTVATTNLPGSLAFSFPADAAAQGTLTPLREAWAYALASSAQNTSTTVVCPATTSVIWRATAGYRIAP